MEATKGKRGRPATGSDPLTNVRLGAAEREALKADALKAGRTVSDEIRARLSWAAASMPKGWDGSA